MRKFLTLFLILALTATSFVSCQDPQGGDEVPDTPPTESVAGSYYADRDVTGRNVARVTMKIKSFGTIKLLLDATSAPRTVANFLTLAKSGFFDGLTFHAAQQFDLTTAVLIGGATASNGSGGSDETVYGEFSANGHQNDIKHKAGVISMLHSNYSLDDATSQFFFCNGDVSDLDGYYAPFGYITDGYKVFEKMMQTGIYYTEQTGLILKSRQPVIISVTVDQDIDYSLIKDAYLVPPTDTELSEVLTFEEAPKKLSLSYAPDSVLRSYETDGGYAFQLKSGSGDSLVNLLLSVDKDGKLAGARTLGYSTPNVTVSADDVIGLDLTALKASSLSDEIKALAEDALRLASAVAADDSASKYVYLRDTEGRDTYKVEMKVEGYDEPVLILLDKTTAPITVQNFLDLVEKGFYNGLDFHRIIKGFMIQGGDDSHLPEEEQATSIKGEFASNGHENDILHLRGTISMARTSVKDSASSGFFICDADSAWLDGEYAAFGYVLSGMATVDAIADYAEGKTDSNGNLNDGVEQPKIEYIKLVENGGV